MYIYIYIHALYNNFIYKTEMMCTSFVQEF